jgi:hypothetical protein
MRLMRLASGLVMDIPDHSSGRSVSHPGIGGRTAAQPSEI